MNRKSENAFRKRVLLAVGGGIAAYKSVLLASALKKAGFEVHAAMTASSRKFIQPLTFESVTGNPVQTALFPEKNNARPADTYPHLYPAGECGVFLLAPATANLMAKLARGLADEIVSASALALSPECKRFFCPAMNVQMWRNDAVRENCRLLEERGWIRIGPGTGEQACGAVGPGRMAEPEEILERVLAKKKSPLLGKEVLILSGPTREYLDDVRYLANASSGAMGQALAEAARNGGARVTLVTGPVDPSRIPRGPAIEVVRVQSAAEMLEAAARSFPRAAAAIFAAAVSDYAPEKRLSGKRSRRDGELLLRFKATEDIAKTLANRKRAGQVVIGFALESADSRKNARSKLQTKNLDGIVLNGPESMGAESAGFEFLGASNKRFEAWGTLSKRECASRVLEKITRLLRKKA
jgi:phosphopantothenoylcysteine decarboxylase/phosphopantothenate--cysteine ligase